MIYHVSPKGCDHSSGTEQTPFKTIGRAAELAISGDTVVVHEGVYREWVDPKNGGLNDQCRITYTAAEGERPVIKGSEIITGWERHEGTVWKKVLPNTMFGDWNPYAVSLEADWFCAPTDYKVHPGDVYINGVSMFEARSMEDLFGAPVRTSGHQMINRNYPPEPISHPERTVYRWIAEVDSVNTTVYCNFQKYDPNKELVEINVRKCCFYPTKTGRNYITVRGFEMAHAACPFVPPTSDQIAMLGVNWSRGWVIEENVLHDAKCSAISIGKEGSTGDNEYWHHHRKYSHYYQTEAVFRALQMGWSRETIGSHVIRNNVIYDCGQTAIVGHMGCAFSRIEHNHIYNIATKHEFYGYEIAGIKLHAPIDVVIENNCIHDCTLGTWLDWQAQGTRVTRNVYYDNEQDFMIEVAHGPCLVDNNIMLSRKTVTNNAQGTAFVHNLMAGNVRFFAVMDRQMPYHFPHSTQVLGIAPVFGGDDRWINNIVLCDKSDASMFLPLSEIYKNNTAPEEYAERIKAPYVPKTAPELPVWMEENVYAKSVALNPLERGSVVAEGFSAKLEVTDGKWYVKLSVPQCVTEMDCRPVSTERLGAPVYSEALYEVPDGTPVDLGFDLVGQPRDGKILPGPFASLKNGEQRFSVWE